MVIVQTSYFANLKNVENPISVAGKCPDFYKGRVEYKKLAPKYDWWKKWHDEKLSNEWYEEQYKKTVLDKLNPKQTLFELLSFYPDTNVITLLCWERSGLFCHRHLIAKWLADNIDNLIIKEL